MCKKENQKTKDLPTVFKVQQVLRAIFLTLSENLCGQELFSFVTCMCGCQVNIHWTIRMCLCVTFEPDLLYLFYVLDRSQIHQNILSKSKCIKLHVSQYVSQLVIQCVSQLVSQSVSQLVSQSVRHTLSLNSGVSQRQVQYSFGKGADST